MQPLGYQQTRSLTVLNTVMDTDSFTSAKTRLNDPTKVELYPSTGDPRDHTVRRGDVLVCKKRAPHWGLEQLPKTRACLNGLVLDTDDVDPDPLDLVDAFWKEYTYVGVSRKDIPVKLTGVAGAAEIQTEPVAVANGMFTITNTGRDRIEASDAVEVYVLERTKRPRAQYQDGKRTRLNDDRYVLGTRTYDMTCRDAVRFFDSSPAMFNSLLNFLQAIANALNPDMAPNDEVLRTALEESEEFRTAMCALINKLHKTTRDAWRTTVGVAQSSNAEGLRVDVMAHPAARVKLDVDDSWTSVARAVHNRSKKSFSPKTIQVTKDMLRKTKKHANLNVFADDVNVTRLTDELLLEIPFADYVNANRTTRALTQLRFHNYFQATVGNQIPVPYPHSIIDPRAEDPAFVAAYEYLHNKYIAEYKSLSNDEFKLKFPAWKYAKLFRALVGRRDPDEKVDMDARLNP